MINERTSQPSSSTTSTGRKRPMFPITSVLGCLLALIGFIYLNWNVSFYISSTTPYPFLSGPGIFQEMAHLYGPLAGLWIWITPAAAAVALVLACVGWFWNTRLLPLVSIPAGMGLVLLMGFLLTGDPWDYYKSNGYWLALLGLLTVLASGLWVRFHESENETSPPALAWCTLVGGGLILLSFFLPWQLLSTPFTPYSPDHPPAYQGEPITGLSLASGSLPFLLPAYPRIAPQGYWLLGLIPLIGLLGIGTAWASLRGRPVSRWFWLLAPLVPLPLAAFLLRLPAQKDIGYYDVQGNITTYGWHLTLLGLTLMFFSGLLWKEGKQVEKPSQEQLQSMRVRRGLLGGIAGLVTAAYGGYLFWQTNKMYSATLTLPLPGKGARYGYSAVAWAADGRRLAMTDTVMLWIWDTVAGKQISSVSFPSFINRDANFSSTSLVWSPDQRFIAVAFSELALVYEVDSGKWVSHWPCNFTFSSRDIAWSANSQYVATTFYNEPVQNSGVEIHDASTGKQIRSFTFPPTERGIQGGLYSPFMCTTVSWSPDNQWLAVGGQVQNKVGPYQVFFTIWDVASGAKVFSTSYTPGITSDANFQLEITLAWSPDGKRLAVASDTTGVKLWDVPGKKLLRTYTGSGGRFAELAWSPDGRYIAASENNVVRIWDTTSGQTLFSYWGHPGINGLSWSPQGNVIASSSLGSVRVWQVGIGNF